MGKIISSLPKSTRVSLSVYNQDSHSFTFAYNQDTPIKPASNMKILTAGAALLYLKPEYRLSTFIYYNGSRITNGVLAGDIYIKGGGNPSLSEDDLKILAERIKGKGITKINGRLIYDNTLFSVKKPKKEIVNELSPITLPAISPLSINNNIISVYNKKGSIKTSFNSHCIKVVLKNKGKSKIEETDKGIIIYLISSAIKKENSSLHFFIRNPALLASLILMEKCSDAGIVISGAPKSGKVPEGLNEISVNTELLNIIKEVNSSSNNFYAETLYETLTSLLPSNNSKDKILSFLHSKGIELKGTVIADGSGISSGNKVSASSLISVLRKISDVEKTGTGFKQTLAVAGISGTLKELYSNSVLKGSFAGKSGFMSGISSLSGYLKTKQGKNFIVSMIFNFSEKDINYYRGIERQILEEIYLKN